MYVLNIYVRMYVVYMIYTYMDLYKMLINMHIYVCIYHIYVRLSVCMHLFLYLGLLISLREKVEGKIQKICFCLPCHTLRWIFFSLEPEHKRQR